MNRKLKALGLAVVAAFAMSAVAATSASASGELFHSDGPHKILEASALNSQKFETTVGITECANVSVHATTGAETTKEITAIPTYTNCTSSIGPTVHVNPTSCAYLFTSETAPHNQVHIECTNPADHIDVNITFFGSLLNCITVPDQTPTGGGVAYKNINKGSGTGHIEIDATVTGIEYTEDGFCGSGVANDGTYTGKVTVKGKTTTGTLTEIWWQ